MGKCADRVMTCTMFCVDMGVKLLGPLLGCVALVLISAVTYVYFVELLPQMVISYGSATSQVLTLFGLFLLFSLLWNYARAMFVGPGSPPEHLDDDKRAALIDDPELRPGKTHRYCSACKVVKPMRTHHCSICKTCVLRMDHHCPWINNCVGWGNYKYFLGFLFYMWSGTAFFLLVSWETTMNALGGRRTSFQLLFTIVMALAGHLATALFLGWNVYLLVTNQTTIESYANIFTHKRISPYHIGAWQNVLEVFGSGTTLFNLFLPSTSRPRGDGCLFPFHPDFPQPSKTGAKGMLQV